MSPLTMGQIRRLIEEMMRQGQFKKTDGGR